MAEQVKNATLKARVTKLGKKSTEDLINIILRKDATERKLNEKIDNQRIEIANLVTRIKNLKEDCSGTEEALTELKKSNQSISDHLTDTIDEVAELNEKIKSLKTLNRILLCISVVAVIAAIVVTIV